MYLQIYYILCIVYLSKIQTTTILSYKFYYSIIKGKIDSFVCTTPYSMN